MAGILSAIKLKEAGLTDFTVYEKASRLGGTWRENTYPGLGCDVPSHLYSYSFALNPNWSHRFSPGAEIQAYLERTAEEHGVMPFFRFGDEVVRCTFERGRWRVETASGHRDEVDIIIAATGVLHHPKIPKFEGIETFAGAAFHSARWDHSVPLDGRRVGVIGTGLHRRADHGRAHRARGEVLAVPAHRAVDHAAGEPPLFRGRAERVPRRSGAVARAARRSLEAVRGGIRERARRRRLARDAGDRGGMPEEPRRQRARSRAEGAAAPELPRRVQATRDLAQLLRGDPAPERRARHRRRSSGSSRAACAPPTGACTSSTCSCSRPASRSIASCARST